VGAAFVAVGGTWVARGVGFGVGVVYHAPADGAANRPSSTAIATVTA
jgi:hypothetical protein